MIAMPCEMSLWSVLGTALYHIRGQERRTLQEAGQMNGFTIETLQSWNAPLRPVAA